MRRKGCCLFISLLLCMFLLGGCGDSVGESVELSLADGYDIAHSYWGDSAEQVLEQENAEGPVKDQVLTIQTQFAGMDAELILDFDEDDTLVSGRYFLKENAKDPLANYTAARSALLDLYGEVRGEAVSLAQNPDDLEGDPALDDLVTYGGVAFCAWQAERSMVVVSLEYSPEGPSESTVIAFASNGLVK